MSVHLRKGNMAWADRKRKEKNMAGAYETKQYRNVFAEYGYSEEEIEKRIWDLWKIPAIMMRGTRACRMA